MLVMNTVPATDTLPTRVSLLDRLKNLDDRCSWEEFVRYYEAKVTHIARQRGLRQWEAEEVAHEVFKRVAQKICEYQPRTRAGSFRSWLFQLTRWRAGDRLRDRARTPGWVSQSPFSDREERTATIERIPAPSDTEAAFEAESRHHLLATLLKHVEADVSPKQLQIFQLLVVDELSPAEVGRLYGVSTNSIYVIKHRVMAKLRAELSRLNLTTLMAG